jgi:hypothetical protein
MTANSFIFFEIVTSQGMPSWTVGNHHNGIIFLSSTCAKVKRFSASGNFIFISFFSEFYY